MKCRQCGYSYQNDDCPNSVCRNAHAQGFCGSGCAGAYFALRDWELAHPEPKASNG